MSDAVEMCDYIVEVQSQDTGFWSKREVFSRKFETVSYAKRFLWWTWKSSESRLVMDWVERRSTAVRIAEKLFPESKVRVRAYHTVFNQITGMLVFDETVWQNGRWLI